MKVFKKVFAFAIALTAIAMATTALADNDVATYDDAKVSAVLSYEDAIAGNQATVAVVPETFGSDEVNAEDIYYINQDTVAAVADMLADGVGLKAALDVPASYQVVVGGVASEIIRFDIPDYVWNNDSVGKQGEVVDGVRRVGVDGSIKINGSAAISALDFILNDGEIDATYTWTFEEAINAIQGVVTFGLEIDAVPEGTTISIVDVTPVMAD